MRTQPREVASPPSVDVGRVGNPGNPAYANGRRQCLLWNRLPAFAGVSRGSNGGRVAPSPSPGVGVGGTAGGEFATLRQGGDIHCGDGRVLLGVQQRHPLPSRETAIRVGVLFKSLAAHSVVLQGLVSPGAGALHLSKRRVVGGWMRSVTRAPPDGRMEGGSLNPRVSALFERVGTHIRGWSGPPAGVLRGWRTTSLCRVLLLVQSPSRVRHTPTWGRDRSSGGTASRVLLQPATLRNGRAPPTKRTSGEGGWEIGQEGKCGGVHAPPSDPPPKPHTAPPG